MIAEGCLKDPKVDAIIGLHIGQLTGDMENGMVALRPGAAMASVDKFSVNVIGKGGHGAMPHQCVDPIVIAAEIITSLQKIVSRELNPLHPAVLTIGKILGGTSFNIISEKVSFEGTVRTLNNDDREYVERRVSEICTSIGTVNRARVEVEYIKFYPVLINDEVFTMRFAESAKKIVDKKKIRFLEEPIMGSEDMSYFLNEVPGTFFFLGSNNPDKGITYPHHHPKFDVDEDVLWMGPALFVQGVLDFLNEKI
jgi:amidohydrolase